MATITGGKGVLAVTADSPAIGSVGVLTVGTRGGGGPGEVRIRIRGGSETFLAWSEEPLPKGAAVLVTSSRGRRAVDVMEWDAGPVEELGDYGALAARVRRPGSRARHIC